MKSKKTYKVWIEIEEYNEKTGDGTTLDGPGASIAEFETYEEAWAYAEALGAFEYHAHSLVNQVLKPQP